MNQISKQMQQKEIDKPNYAARAERTEAAEKVKVNHMWQPEYGFYGKPGFV